MGGNDLAYGQQIRPYGLYMVAETTELSVSLRTLGMSATGAGHAAFDHPHLELTTTGARFTGRHIQIHHLRFRVRFQSHAFPLDEVNGDHVLFDHPADGGKN